MGLGRLLVSTMVIMLVSASFAVTSHADVWRARSGHAMVSFKNMLVVIGGFSTFGDGLLIGLLVFITAKYRCWM